MRQLDGKRYWLVGASEGLGAALAHALSRAGAHVVLSARSEDRLADLARSLPGPSSVQALDVADMISVTAAAAAIGPVDGVIFMAGVYWPISAMDWDAEDAVRMADINFTGVVRVMGVAVPPMVARDSGHVVIVGSLSGFRGLPGTIGYSASKAGAMVLAESMRADLRGTGVDVQLVNPGFVRTRLTAKNDFSMPFIQEPEEAAALILGHMRTRRFARSFPNPFAWLFRVGPLLPNWVYFRLYIRLFG